MLLHVISDVIIMLTIYVCDVRLMLDYECLIGRSRHAVLSFPSQIITV